MNAETAETSFEAMVDLGCYMGKVEVDLIVVFESKCCFNHGQNAYRVPILTLLITICPPHMIGLHLVYLQSSIYAF